MARTIVVTASHRKTLNLSLGAEPIFLLTMFKRLLLATLIVFIGMWGAGYDVWAIKDTILSAADKNAGNMSGRNQIEGGDWGPDA